MVVAITLLLAGAVALFVAAPLFTRVPLSEAVTRAAGLPLDEGRLRLLADLYDLETTFHAGRVAHRDYRRLRDEIERELAAVLRRIDAVEAAELEIAVEADRELGRRRGIATAAGVVDGPDGGAS